jgi:hypothetical protein
MRESLEAASAAKNQNLNKKKKSGNKSSKDKEVSSDVSSIMSSLSKAGPGNIWLG